MIEHSASDSSPLTNRESEVLPSVKNLRESNKYEYLFILQGDYGTGYGWEDLAASEKETDAKGDLKAYYENEGGKYRIIQRRERKIAEEEGAS